MYKELALNPPPHCKNKQAKHTETYMENQFNQLFSTAIHLIQ